MENTKQNIQGATSDYLVSTPTPDRHLLNTTDDTIKYIKEFIQTHHSYSEYPTTQDHPIPDIRAEARATTAATATAFTPNAGRPTFPL